jgi:hypothetical protein
MIKPCKIVVNDKKIRLLKYTDKKFYVEIKIGWWLWSKWVQIKPGHRSEQEAIKTFNKIKKNPSIVKFKKNGTK